KSVTFYEKLRNFLKTTKSWLRMSVLRYTFSRKLKSFKNRHHTSIQGYYNVVGDDKRQQECRIIEPSPVFHENSIKRENTLGKSKSEDMKKRNQKLYLTPLYNH
ncbi:hypothetical protein, partial [Prevotella sp.]|uniref:hypothetical protein n=1 Tax=Prevotella sp. TaxID=59823 RepID=UPI003FD83CA6